LALCELGEKGTGFSSVVVERGGMCTGIALKEIGSGKKLKPTDEQREIPGERMTTNRQIGRDNVPLSVSFRQTAEDPVPVLR